MGTDGITDERTTSSEYLAQLLKDKKQLQAFPSAFVHLERLLDDEISRVRGSVFSLSASEPLHLPEPLGPVVTLVEKLTVPVKEFPDFNFVGRLLGPRGMTAKQLELDTGCKILVRGQGSMRDRLKEEQMKGKPKWEHLNEQLHVLITVEDSKNRASIKLRRAVEEVKKLLVPIPECDDELKKRQLIELAIINGTYRGLNGILVSANGTTAGVSSLGLSVFGPQSAMGAPLSVGPHMRMGPHVAMAPMMLPMKTSDHAAVPILFAPPPMTVLTGSLTPLQSPGPITPVTPIQSPGVMGNGAHPLLFPSEGGMLYQLEPCIASSHSSSPFEYSISAQPHSAGIASAL